MMTSTDNRIDELISRIKNHGAVAEFEFIPAFPPSKTPNPIKRYTVTVENHETANRRYFIGDLAGVNVKGCVIGTELRMRVYAPSRTSGSALLRAASMLMDAADAEDHEGWIRSFLMTGIGFDTASRTEYRDVILRLETVIGEAER